MKLTTILLLLLLVSCSSKKHISCINENPNYWEGTSYINSDTSNDYSEGSWQSQDYVDIMEDSTAMKMTILGTGDRDTNRKPLKVYPSIKKSESKDTLSEDESLLMQSRNPSHKSEKLNLRKFIEGADREPQRASIDQLTSDKWYFSTIKDILVDGGNKPEPDKCYLKFNNSGIVNGKTSCNSFSGSFDVDEDGIVTISGLVMTYKSCEKPEVRKKYVDFLSQKFRYIIRQDTLGFLDSDDNVIAKFVR